MKDWYTVQELVGTAGLPTTERGILKAAVRESWQSRPRSIGKGNEYHLSSLPAETQRALKIAHAKRGKSYQAGEVIGAQLQAAEHHQKQQQLNKRLAGSERYVTLKGAARTRADAKLEIIHRLDDFIRDTGLNKNTAVETFATLYNRREIELADWVLQAEPKVSRPTLYRWQAAIAQDGLAALAGKYGNRKGSGVIDNQPELKEAIIGLLVTYSHAQYPLLMRSLRARFAGQAITLPSLSTLSRWCNDWMTANASAYTAVTNPDKWKNQFMVAFGNASEHVINVNQLWEMDSTPGDVMLLDGRHSILGVIDVHTRRLKLRVSKTSTAAAIGLLLRETITDWGVPEVIKTDNGQDYKSRFIRTVIRQLDIEQEFCPPFQGWRKPHIERAFKTFSHDLVELLPGYIGHNVAERKVLEASASFSERLFAKDGILNISLNSNDLQAFCDRWVDEIYHHKAHSELGCTPLEQLNNWRGSIRTVADKRVLDILMAQPAGSRMVGKKGIKLDRGEYIHPALAAYSGQEVSTFYADDMGEIFVYDQDGEFVCIAEDPTLTGVSRAEVANHARELQKQRVAEERQALKAAAKKVTQRDVAKELLDHAAATNLQNQIAAGQVAIFPKPETPHTSQGLEAASAALTSLKGGHRPPEASPEMAARAEAGFKLLEANFRQPVEQIPSDLYDKYEFYLSLKQRQEHGETLPEKLIAFLRSYPGSVDYSSGKLLADLRQETA